jgi:hypothetical protein
MRVFIVQVSDDDRIARASNLSLIGIFPVYPNAHAPHRRRVSEEVRAAIVAVADIHPAIRNSGHFERADMGEGFAVRHGQSSDG